ncbi:MAG TPA: hypothetical protein VMU67_00910 [Steroidobacteraceae bacterium]|nr:hypothetical protein [Steroidobacteraceae bacterium]
MDSIVDRESLSGAAAATEPRVTRNAMIDAMARALARGGPSGLPWSAIVREAESSSLWRSGPWFGDVPALVEECYARTARALEQCLLRAETAPGTALDQVAAFLVAAFELRRDRTALLALQPPEGMPPTQCKRLREWDLAIRMRIKRLLLKGRRDGSLALRHADSACAMILACLQVPLAHTNAAEQQMWDGELIELLLAAIAEPHPQEGGGRRAV